MTYCNIFGSKTYAIKTIEGNSMPDNTYIKTLNNSLKIFFKDAVRFSLKSPTQARYFFNVVRWQKKAVRTRSKWAENNIHVPPIIIFSITNRCNLQCKGCYAQALGRSAKDDLSDEDVVRIIREAHDLGTSFFVLAGGEPMVRKQIMDITSQFSDVIFLMFTNGLLLTDSKIKQLKKQKNVVPVISLEGHESQTDARRGKGVYNQLQKIVQKLQKANIFYSISFTVTSLNVHILKEESFLAGLINAGCKLFFFLEYTAITDGTEEWIPTDEQREQFSQAVSTFRQKYPALFVNVPDDEDQFGGCLSSGRGFLHINANGDLEPCPFAPFSDTNLKNKSLKEALKSDLLRVIRDNADQLEEGRGGCTLWQKREWVKSLLVSEES